MRTLREAAVVGAAIGVLVLAGCASAPAGEAGSQAPQLSPASLVMTPGAVTVLDDGTGAELCLGMMAMSYPPQCGGASVVGWDWDDWTGSFTEAAGVRWGMFTLTGEYDAEAFEFTPTEVAPWHENDETTENPWGSEVDFTTPCTTPDGGWRVLDAERTSDETMNRAFERAAELPGYAASWVDRSRIPQVGSDATAEEEVAATASSPELTIVNVAVVGDTSAAEAVMREEWGGMLCVSAAERTEAELQDIAAEVTSEDSLSSGTLGVAPNGMTGQVELQVVYDDGSLQRQLDDEYGAGIVVVSSMLRSVN
ncbi:hypothetical protein [Microbacterium esteraromaticum]|uniref:hypothetical protein n=1 Tax=Microbacterium esteraromaticum TaxID=57043 RepID=UPI00117FB3F8|nr:hypothetical protein [Microbacterium esteraromaticum]